MRIYRLGLMGVAGIAALAIAAAPANAAVTVGETFVPTTIATGSFTVYVASGTPGPTVSYVMPSSGVLTSWSARSGATVPAFVRAKVGRLTPPTTVTTIGESAREIPLGNQITTFPARIPVQAGDILGFHYPTAWTIARFTLGYQFLALGGDQGVGSTGTYVNSGSAQGAVSAQLEPDADNDGFGDETQDLCPSDADTVKACRDKTPPETTITKKPKKKDKKKKPKFEFNSSESAPTFRCSLNGSAFEPCTSPHGVKAKKGLNTFTVFAKDAAGNADETPATYSWTYKKPKKKK